MRIAVEDVLGRVRALRPRVAAALERPHAEEALLVGVLADLAGTGSASALGRALGTDGDLERLVLWGIDLDDGEEDLRVAAAVHDVVAGGGLAVRLEAEPDLVVVTSLDVLCIDATVGRPGHAAARATRGEPVPGARLDEVAAGLGNTLGTEGVAASYPVARAAAVAMALGRRTARRPSVVALVARPRDLLRPGTDPLEAWSAMARTVSAALPDGPRLRARAWAELADDLEPHAGTAAAVRRLRDSPLLPRPNRPGLSLA